MLIVPLHRPLTRATFPLVTALLVLVNVCVFVLLQSGDPAARMRALEFYGNSGLAERELPAYLAHLADADRQAMQAQLQPLPEPLRHATVAERIARDAAFRERLAAGTLPGFDADWRRRRDAYEALRARVFTEQHVQRYDQLDAFTPFSAAFLHGGAGHLAGNMLFLALLGLLVEAVLGAWRFLGLYLFGALGAGLAGWAWNWGEPGAVLGASGAIAALMGAYSVLWAGRRVRVFYWFLVLFDYVRVPALWLLPAWLGWELLQMWLAGDAGVAFDAHAGGLVSGALLAVCLRRAGWWRPDALDDDSGGDAQDADMLLRALQHLGHMEPGRAEPLLQQLLQRQPDAVALHVALFRCARLSAASPREVGARAGAVLDARARTVQERQQQLEVAAEADQHGIALALPSRLRLVRTLLAAGDAHAAHGLLQRTRTADTGAHAAAAAAAAGPLAQAWLEVGVALHDRGAPAEATAAWRLVTEEYPSAPQAAKARFLLEAQVPAAS